MIYPNTQPSGVAGGQDNKKRLQQLLSRSGAAPLFGGSGRSASAATLPNVGAPALSFNPFLQALNNHPNETFNDLPANNPLDGYVGSSLPTTSGVASSGVAAPPQGQAQANPFDTASAGYEPGGHFNPAAPPIATNPNIAPNYNDPAQLASAYQQTQPAQSASSLGQLSQANPFYHTLMQLALYGYDS